MAIQNLYNDDWDGYTHDDVEEALKAKLQEMEQAIQEAAASGAVPPDEEMDGDSTNAVQNKIIKAYIDGAVSLLETAISAKYTKPTGGIPAEDLAPGVIPIPDSALGNTDNPVKNRVVKAAIENLKGILDTITGGEESVTEAIDTFNEVKAFLEGISSSDTLAAKLAQLTTDISGKQNTLTFDNAPTANSNNPVKSGGIYTALQELLGNISIGQNGNWFIGQTDTEVKARGVDGINVSDPADIEVVHNLNDEKSENFDPTSQVAVLGADMGKELAEMVASLETSMTASVKVINGKNVLVFEDATTPVIIASVASLAFGEVENGKSKSLTFTVRGRWTTGNIAVTSGSTKVVCSPLTSDGSLTTITATYTPTSDDETLSTNIVLSATGCENVTIAVTGEGVEEVVPEITLTPSTLTIGTSQGTSATGTINVKGKNLEDDITLALSGTGASAFSLSANSVSKADAEAEGGVDITVTFDGSADASATLTASTTNGDNVTASLEGDVVAQFDNNTYFTNGIYQYFARTGGKADVQYAGSGTVPASISIPDTVSDAGKTNNNGVAGEGFVYTVYKVNTQGFQMKNQITSVSIGNNVTTLAKEAFYLCPNIASVVLGSSVQEIGELCFAADSADNALVSINFPSSLTTIGNTAFKYCPLSTSGIDLPSGLTSIGQFAFQYCKAKTIRFRAGSSLTIGDYAFNNWSGKTDADADVYIHADTLPVLGTSSFDSACAATLHVRSGVTVNGGWETRFSNIEYDAD